MPNSRSVLSSSSLTAVGASVALGESGSSFVNAYSAELDGVDEYCIGDVNVTNSSPLNDLSDAATIAIWAKLGDQTGTVFWVANTNVEVGGKPISNRELQIQSRADVDKILFHVVTSAGAVTEFAGSTTLGDGNWHHYAISWNGTTAVYYLDGSTTGSSDSIGGTLDDQSGKEIRNVEISRKGYYAAAITGHVDEAAVWNVALSAADITAIYNSGAPNDLLVAGSYDTDRTSNLIGWWRMGDGTEAASGATVYDMSGQSVVCNLTATNMEVSDYDSDVPS